MSKKVVEFPTDNLSLGDSILVVKNHLNDCGYNIRTKVHAIQNVAQMETHNSVTKDELVRSLRWLFAHYEFEEE